MGLPSYNYTIAHHSLPLGNHRGILEAVGFTDIREYRYWNAEDRNLNFDGMLQDLKVSGGVAIVIT